MPTAIYEIHGAVPPNEYSDRGREVRGQMAYIPYTALTKGEMKLALLLEQANIYAAAFPENKEYRQAANMLYSSLRAGVSNGVSFVGALYNPLLQQVAREVSKAARQTAPAAKGGLLGRVSLSQGISGIGEVEFKFNFDHDCVQYAVKKANQKYRAAIGGDKNWQWWEKLLNDSDHRRYYRQMKAECKVKIEIEQIVNARIENASHHVLYHNLDEAYPAITGTAVITKHLLQLGGVAGLANATETDQSLMGIWSETSILKKNTVAGVGPIGSVPSSFYLAPDPDAFNDSYLKWKATKVYDNPKKGKIGSLAAVTALIVAIGTAVGKAADMQRALNEKRAGAMGSALNYGTPALESLQSDFNTAGGSGSGSNGLLLAAAAAGIYLLTK